MDHRYFFYTTHLIELITAIVATITWKKYRHTTERDFIYFFWVVFAIDFLGAFIAYTTHFNNAIIYNCLQFFYFLFFLNWYRKILEYQKEIYILYFCFFIIALVSIYFENIINELLTINYVGGVIIILILSLAYYLQLLKNDAILSLKEKLAFWITIGNIIFFVAILPLLLLHKYMKVTGLSYLTVLTIINLVTYSCYILGFKWTKSN